jgi:hypothetical protein
MQIPIHIPICEAAEIAELKKYGSYDFAVPHQWSIKNPGHKAVWFYNHSSRIWGRPLAYLAILRLARRKCKDAYDLMRIEAAIASFNPSKLTAQNLIQLLNA